MPVVVRPEPKAIVYFNLTPDGARLVAYAVRLLEQTLPDEYEHLFREIDFITVSTVCGRGTNGCTNVAGNERTIYLSRPPETMNVIELAILIAHEAKHHLTINGIDYVQPHDCRDCSDPFERANDWLYIWEDSVRPLLQNTHELNCYFSSVA
jgi:hypothetical protein